MSLVVAELKAVFSADLTDLKRGEAEAVASTRRVGDAMESSGRRSDRAWQAAGRAGRAGFIAGAAGLLAMQKANVSFDKSMSAVSAATMETEGNLKRLREAAIQAGADTSFSATEAAGGITELAKAGVSTRSILAGGLKGALDLAAAGQIGVAEAAETAASALTQFKLEGRDVPKVADLLAAGAGKAQGGVRELSQALGQSGLIAAQTGLTLEDTVGALSAFASAGLLGSDAGTSFKTMLMSLNPRSKEAAQLMRQYGIEAYDAQGNFVGLAEYAGKLKTGLAGLSTEQRNAALQTIFGSDAIRAANILYSQGERGIERWTRKVDDQGYAAKTAAEQTDNLAGDIERFTGSLETAFIKGGSGAQEGLRDIVKGAESIVDAFNDLPPAVQENSVKAVAGLTATGGLLWALSKARTAIDGLRGGGGVSRGGGLAKAATASRVVPVYVTNPGFSGPGGPGRPGSRGGGAVVAPTPSRGNRAGNVARGAAGVAAGVVGLDFVVQLLGGRGVSAELGEVTESLRLARSAGDDMQSGFMGVRNALQQSNVGKYANDLGIDLNRLAADIQINGDQGAYLNDTMKRLSSGGLKDAAAGLADFLTPGWDSRVKLAGRAVDDLGRISSEAGRAARDGSQATERALGGIGGLLAQMVVPNFRAYQQVLRGLPEEVITVVAERGTELTRRNVRQLAREYDLTPRQVNTLMGLVGDGPTRKKLDAVKAQMAATNALKALPLIGQRGAEKTQRDVTGVIAAAKLLDRQRPTPKTGISGVGAVLGSIASVGAALGRLDGDSATTYIRTVRIEERRSVSSGTNAYTSGVGGGVRKADGGYITGPGGPRDDLIDARVSNGEFIVNAAATKRNRALLERLNSGGPPRFVASVRAFADGGYVGGTAAASRIDVLEAQKEIKDLQRELAARKKKRVGKGKKRKLVDAGPQLKGLDRQIAQERLRIAEEELVAMRKGVDLGATRSLQDTVRTAMAGGIFDTGATSAAQLLKNLQTRQVTNQAWASMIAGLSKAGLSKPLIDQLIGQGPTSAGLKLGQDILRRGLAGQISGAAGVLTTQGATAAAYAGGTASSPVAPVKIEHWHAAPGQSEQEMAERLYFVQRIRR